MISMVAAGISQYLLFIRNAEKEIVLPLLESLAMQFVLTADEKLMMSAWKGWTTRRLEHLMNKEHTIDDMVFDEAMLKKIRLMYFAEEMFLSLVAVVGLGWSIALGYCM